MIQPLIDKAVEKMRDLYLHESPDKDGYFTRSIAFSWGTFDFTPDHNSTHQSYYLTTQSAIEDFLKQKLQEAYTLALTEFKEELEKRIKEKPHGRAIEKDCNENNCPIVSFNESVHQSLIAINDTFNSLTKEGE